MPKTSTIEPQYDLDAETLSGDIRDVLLRHMKDMNVGWSFLPEREQREKIAAATQAAEASIRQAVNLIATFNFPNLSCEIGAVKIDKGLEIKLGALASVPNITALAEHGKGYAVLVLIDPQVFNGEKAPAEPDPDQTDAFDKGKEAA